MKLLEFKDSYNVESPHSGSHAHTPLLSVTVGQAGAMRNTHFCEMGVCVYVWGGVLVGS